MEDGMLLDFCKLWATAFFLMIGIALANTPALAETWNSDWGPVQVEADGSTFIARYNNPVSGVIVMRNQGGGNYAGYWARKCTNNRNYQIPAPVYSSEGSCSQTRKTASGSNTRCWGIISGHADASDTRFMGTFSTCNGRRIGDWNGWR